MRSPLGARLLPLLFTVATLITVGRSASAQSTERTPDGHPDLQGLWLNNTATPLERPRAVNGRAAFTDAEARDYESHYQLDRLVAISRNKSFELDAAGDLDTFEPGPLLPGNRTSMITDPSDGSVPALTPEARRRVVDRAAHLDQHYADNPEDLTDADRCLIVGNTSVPPLLPAFYNNTLQIVQTRDSVLLVSEQIHDTRVISLTRREHLPPTIRRWSGDSIGRWDGDTLVVDTTNFTTKTSLRGSGPGLHIVERFSLGDAKTLSYQFTIDDPSSFTRTWTAESQMRRTNEMMYEFACHEANYSMGYILSGARFTESHR